MCALRGPPEFRSLLKIGGELDGDQQRFETFVQEMCPEKANHGIFKINWNSWTGYPGVLAKLVMGGSKMAAQRRKFLQIDPYSIENFEKEDWIELLKNKFEKNPEYLEVLMSTGEKTLIEFDRHAGSSRGSKWGGLFKDGNIVGENRMGKYLMEVREFFKK